MTGSTTSRYHRVLAIANEALEADPLRALIREHADGSPADVLVVAPALNSRVRHWLSDEDGARSAAEARLEHSVEQLRSQGIGAGGWVGDADPLTAIDDALAIFPADELIISTPPESRSNWMAHDVVRRARERFGLPTAAA